MCGCREIAGALAYPASIKRLLAPQLLLLHEVTVDAAEGLEGVLTIERSEHRRAHLVVHLVDRLAGHLAPFLLVLGERLPKRRGEEAAEGGAVGASALGDDLSESLVREGGIVEARLSLRRHERQSPERQAGGKPQRVQGFLSNQRFGGELLSNARDAIMKLINWMRSKHEIGARI